MDLKKYSQNLGSLIVNLHGLEFSLRAFLAEFNIGGEPRANVASAQVGDLLPMNSFTNYDSLSDLIKKYNAAVDTVSPSSRIDPTVVDIRDMLAHGRVAGSSLQPPFELLKFGKEKKGSVRLEKRVLLDEKWFASTIPFVFEQMRRIVAANDAFGFKVMEFVNQ